MQQIDSIGVRKTKVKPDREIKERLANHLKSQGYKIEQDAVIKGNSSGEHTFDILALKSDSFMTYTIAIDITVHDDEQEIGLGEVFTFDDKCYDCNIQDKVFIAIPLLDAVASRFARGQQIIIFHKENMEVLFASSSPARQFKESTSVFKTKTEFLKSLRDSGYKIEEKAKLNGKSGTEYTFDILAELDEGFIVHRLGIDVMTDEGASLNQVSLFDTKAYDTRIRNKILLISGEVTLAAQQFAQQQKIKFLQLSSKVEKPLVKEEIPQEPGAAKDSLEEVEAPSLQSAIEELLVEAAEVKPDTQTLKRRLLPEVLQLIPETMARRFKAIPVAINDNVLKVAMFNPADIFALEALALQSRMRIEPIAASEKEVREAIDFNYKGYGQIEEQISQIPITAEEMDEADLVAATADAPVASALRLIIDEATKARASDIHIEPEEDKLRIRYRIDGTLQEIMSLPLKVHRALTSRIKIMSDMNIADHLRPQDGQFSTEAKGRMIDVRVATTPTVHGEMTVLRLLDKALAIIGLPQLGFSPGVLARYENMLKVPFGMILVSGPTGAGKTTTLYASVNQLDKISRNIITIEDPVEYRFPVINQIEVNPKAGLTFASGLRSILRLDPDIILVGEIRDAETARIAVQSALTGHLVLSSIHANDAIGVIFRLLDLGIESFLVSSAVIGVVAQRMVRTICPNCSTYKEVPLIEQSAYTAETMEKRTKFLQGAGCELCSHTGYRGRTGIFEVLPISDNIRMQMLDHANTAEIRKQAIEEGMVPLIKDGMLKVKEGITTPSEVLRNAYFIE